MWIDEEEVESGERCESERQAEGSHVSIIGAEEKLSSFALKRNDGKEKKL